MSRDVISLQNGHIPLRRIEHETGVRRETASAYLAGIGVRPRGLGASTAGKTGQPGGHRVEVRISGERKPQPENLPKIRVSRTILLVNSGIFERAVRVFCINCRPSLQIQGAPHRPPE